MHLGRLIGLIVFLCFATPALGNQIYYVSQVDKGSINRFFIRLATPTHQIVVTANPVANKLSGQRVVVPEGKHLYLKELQVPSNELQKGEVGRIAGYIIVVSDDQDSIHDKNNPYNVLLKVPKEEETYPVVESPALKLNNAAASFASIDEAFLRDRLEKLTGAKTVVIEGHTHTITERGSTTNKRLARLFLKQEYEAIGFRTSEHNYGGGVNFIAEKVGRDTEKVLLVTSHLDSMGNAGADDNGGGTISALAMAKALKDQDFLHTLRVVAFDEEEDGMIGSGTYARALKDADQLSQIVGVINLEMPGYDEDRDGAFHVIDCNENTSAQLSRQVIEAVEREDISLNKVDACTNRSDHAVFWRYDVPAIVISQNFFGGDSNPCYHMSCDRTDRMDFDYMRKITEALTSAAAAVVVAR